MTNVIKFTKKQDITELETFEKVETQIFKDAKHKADKSAEYLWSSVLMDMNDSDFDMNKSSSELRYASILVLESIRSLHYLTLGIEHPLQDRAKEMFTIPKKDK